MVFSGTESRIYKRKEDKNGRKIYGDKLYVFQVCSRWIFRSVCIKIECPGIINIVGNTMLKGQGNEFIMKSRMFGAHLCAGRTSKLQKGAGVWMKAVFI